MSLADFIRVFLLPHQLQELVVSNVRKGLSLTLPAPQEMMDGMVGRERQGSTGIPGR